MLNKLRNFTKTKLATVLIGIIIIPFVFWGMGGVFQGGNTNNIAKIKNVNISTEDFFDHIRSLGINEEIISKNIENNILTEILNDLLAKKFIELEIKKLGININDESLLLIIKNNKNFLDENKIKIGNSEYYFDSLPDEAKKLVAGLRTADTQLRMHEDTLRLISIGKANDRIKGPPHDPDPELKGKQVVYCTVRGMLTMYKSGVGLHPFKDTVLIVDEVDDLIVDRNPNEPFAMDSQEKSEEMKRAFDALENNLPKPPDVSFPMYNKCKSAKKKVEGVGRKHGLVKDGGQVVPKLSNTYKTT